MCTNIAFGVARRRASALKGLDCGSAIGYVGGSTRRSRVVYRAATTRGMNIAFGVARRASALKAFLSRRRRALSVCE